MASVFRAHDERLNRDVALKILDPGYSSDFIYRARFEREYRITALLQNEHIVPIYDGGSWHDQLYIAMMLVEGPNLAEIMHNDGPLGLPRVVSIVSQMADALDDAHSQRVIHRDVKPANVLVLRQGGKEHVYLADFGLTLGMEGTRLTRTGGFMGTLAYTAPEQLNSAPIDGRADEYALAATTFHMITGEMPYRRDNEMALINAQLFDAPPLVTDLRPDLPPRVAQVIAKGMAKKPEDRYRTCGEFAAALAAASARFAAAPTITSVAKPPRSRVAVPAVALGLVAAAVIGGGITFALFAGGPGASPLPPFGSFPVAVGGSPSAVPATVAPPSVDQPSPSAVFPSLAPTPTGTSSSPTRTPRPTPRSTPPNSGPTPTPPISTPTPTPTPTATPPPAGLPLVADGNWSVDNSPRSVSGDPSVNVGEHRRRYVITSHCDSVDSCRLTANTFDSSTGKRLGSITFKWDGSEYRYRGGADWYRREGGASCQTSSGEIANAYSTHEEVRVVPQGGSPSTHMTGTKTISGTPTAAGEAAGCAAFTMTYDVDMTSGG